MPKDESLDVDGAGVPGDAPTAAPDEISIVFCTDIGPLDNLSRISKTIKTLWEAPLLDECVDSEKIRKSVCRFLQILPSANSYGDAISIDPRPIDVRGLNEGATGAMYFRCKWNAISNYRQNVLIVDTVASIAALRICH